MINSYIAKHQNESIRRKSRSGGIFAALSDSVLDKNGVIYGCALNDNFEAVHIRAENKEERDLMCGSKYVQSRMGNTFLLVKKDLEDGRRVLFSGTSCQVDGLKSFLGKDYDNLLCTDIVCHGVPSPMVWADYIKWQEKKHGGKVEHADFRDKERFGWALHYETLVINGKAYSSEIYKQLFFQHNVLRPSCFKCPYKSLDHPGDITLADAWGIDRANPDFNDNKGVSLVLINTKKGETVFEEIRERCSVIDIDIENYIQQALSDPCEMPEDRNDFWKYYKSKPFQKVAAKYTDEAFLRKLRLKLSGIKKRIM